MIFVRVLEPLCTNSSGQFESSFVQDHDVMRLQEWLPPLQWCCNQKRSPFLNLNIYIRGSIWSGSDKGKGEVNQSFPNYQRDMSRRRLESMARVEWSARFCSVGMWCQVSGCIKVSHSDHRVDDKDLRAKYSHLVENCAIVELPLAKSFGWIPNFRRASRRFWDIFDALFMAHNLVCGLFLFFFGATRDSPVR